MNENVFVNSLKLNKSLNKINIKNIMRLNNYNTFFDYLKDNKTIKSLTLNHCYIIKYR